MRRIPLTTCAAVAALLASACTGGPAGVRTSEHPAGSGSTGAPTAGRAVRIRVVAAGFDLPAPIQREVAVADAGRLLIVGGLSAAGSSVNGVFEVDPSTGHVAQVGTVPQPFHDATGQLLGGLVFVFGGGAGQSSDVVQTFDPVTRQGALAGRLPVALSDVASAIVGTTVYVVGGYDGQAPRREIYATTDGRRFDQAGTLPVGLRYAAVASDGGGLVIAGGVSANGPVDTVDRFDPRTGKVTPLGHLSRPVGHAAAFVLGGVVFVAGGEDAAGDAVATIWRIDPVAGTVSTAGSLPHAVSDAGVASEPGRAWLLGGLRAIALKQVLEATLVPS